METTTINFDIDTTDAEARLSIEVWIDDVCLYQNSHVKELYQFSHAMSDENGNHELKIIMQGKTIDHTSVDSQGNILKDALISVTNMQVDGIDIGPLFHKLAQYQHDFNGTQPPTQENFFAHMGCNGTLSLQFSTPMYLWLLENM
jgi:hypothetical protein